MKNPGLWQSLEHFSVDDESSALRFVDRLAADNGWARSYAEEAFEEYLRFVYLAASGDELMTPSDAVDQVWHLHLAYSHSYWDELCGRVLGRRLHHGPTRGGAAEQARYREAYGRTLAAYREEFGRDAPHRIWPPVELRFRTDLRYRRVDTAGRLVVGKRFIAGLVLAVALLGALIAATGDWSTLRGAVGTLALLLGVPAAVLVGMWLIEKLGIRGGKGGGGSCGTGGCSSGCGSSCGGGCGGS